MTVLKSYFEYEANAGREPVPFAGRIPPGRRRPANRMRFLDAARAFEYETREAPREDRVTLVAVTEAELRLLQALLAVADPVTPEQAVLRQLPALLASRASAVAAGAAPEDAVHQAPLQIDHEQTWVRAMTGQHE